ncbi:MAG: hypothetical protein KA251_09670 [Saprospiraceae bacterium]|jgi:hypothetical protein|nr:hypothetical protein [Candidatus Vicinibacter affinis]MBP6174556.1 hypothetical protein [Saprospiraceae bacterium]MBP6523250.1 hypothetical protein [Saprospiraceae bacterium]
MKTHWKKLTNPNYIGAYSMPEGKDLTVEITDVKREVVKGEGGKTDECTVLYLKDSKPMILNVTNSKMISKVHNTPFIEEWIGKKITLYVSTTSLKGEKVECLRVRDILPTEKKKPELTPGHTKWAGAKKAIQEGNYTVDKLKEVFFISPENEEVLNEKV